MATLFEICRETVQSTPAEPRHHLFGLIDRAIKLRAEKGVAHDRLITGNGCTQCPHRAGGPGVRTTHQGPELSLGKGDQQTRCRIPVTWINPLGPPGGRLESCSRSVWPGRWATPPSRFPPGAAYHCPGRLDWLRT